jgi:hypothetical protein
MEDLLAKFYGKPESEGSSGAPVADESASQLEAEQRLEHGQPLEQRVGLVETQLLQMARAQQAILARLDTMIEQQDSQPSPPELQHTPSQEPPPPPKPAWRPAWKDPRPERQPKPKAPRSDDGTPLAGDPVNKMLHSLDDASEDVPPAKGHSADKHMRACTICGRQFPQHKGKMARSSQHGPETLHCPKCYSAHQATRTTRTAILVAVFGVLGVIFLIATLSGRSGRSEPTNNPPRIDFPTLPASPTPHPRFPVPRRR